MKRYMKNEKAMNVTPKKALKGMNKKAIMFSLISVLFAVLFITIFSQKFSDINEERLPGSNMRIKIIDTYIRNLDIYIGDSIKISTYHTLDSITNYSRKNGFFSDKSAFDAAFYNCMTCGYVDCSNQSAAKNCSLDQYYLKFRLDNITALSLEQLNIDTVYNINSISITQHHPFEVEVTVNLSYNVTDNSSHTYYAHWNKQLIITRPVTIIGLLDPTGYINDSGNNYTRRIIRYAGDNVTAPCEFDPSCWNYTNTEIFYNSKTFRDTPTGTSFLQRYWNDYNQSDWGIETILHPSELTNPNKNNSYIDHYYWSGLYTCNSGKIIVNLTFNSNEDIHLDNGTATWYQLRNNSVTYCP